MHNYTMNKSHPLAQFLTGFCAVSILTLLYVATPNRSVPSSRTPTQAMATHLAPLNLP
jgi:hypothetical protein